MSQNPSNYVVERNIEGVAVKEPPKHNTKAVEAARIYDIKSAIKANDEPDDYDPYDGDVDEISEIEDALVEERRNAVLKALGTDDKESRVELESFITSRTEGLGVKGEKIVYLRDSLAELTDTIFIKYKNNLDELEKLNETGDTSKSRQSREEASFKRSLKNLKDFINDLRTYVLEGSSPDEKARNTNSVVRAFRQYFQYPQVVQPSFTTTLPE